VAKGKVMASAKKSLVQPNSAVVPGTQYSVKRQTVEYVVPQNLSKEESYSLELSGKAQLKVEVLDSKDTLLESYVCKLNQEGTSSYMLFDSGRYLGVKGHKLVVRNIDSDDSSAYNFVLTKVLGIELEFGTYVQVLSHFASDVRLKVTQAKDTPETPIDRHQFFAQTKLDSQVLTGDERIGMFINGLTKAFPTSSTFDLKASANDGIGVVKSLSAKSPHFCKAPDCAYHVTVASNDVDTFWFYPTTMSHNNVIGFADKLVLLEELEPEETLGYVMVPQTPSTSFLLELTPIEHGTTCVLNVGVPVSSGGDNLHVFNSTTKSSFYVTPLQFSQLTRQDDNVYLSCASTDKQSVSTFQLRVSVVEEEELPRLEPNGCFSGRPIHREVINYNFDFKAQTKEKVNMGFKLSVANGSGLIIVKECLQEGRPCTLNDKDIALIQAKDKSLFKGESIFRFTTAETKAGDFRTNSLVLSFYCKPGNMDLGLESDQMVLVSESCSFAVAVWFDQEAKDKPMFYALETSSANNHQLLTNKRSATLKSPSSGVYFFRLPVKADPSAADVKVQIRVFVLTGKGSLFLANNQPYPFENNCQAQLNFRHETKTSIQTKSYQMDFDLKADDLRVDSNLYMAIRTEGFTILDILPVVMRSKAVGDHLEVIVPGESYTRLISSTDLFVNTKGQRVFFRNFHLELPRALFNDQAVQSLELNLNSNALGLKLCVVSSPEAIKQQKVDRCDFESSMEHLKLTKEQVPLVANSTLLVSVQKVDDPVSPVQHLPIQFELSSSVNDSETEYELSLPGSTLRSFSERGKQVKIRFDLGGMAADGTLFLTSEDPLVEVSVFKDMGTEQVLIASLSSLNFGLHIVNATEFKSVYCDANCVLSALVFTKSNTSHPFAFTFTYDSRPIVVKDGLALKVPNNLGLYFLFESKSESHADFSFFSHEEKSVAFARIIGKEALAKESYFTEEISEIKYDLKSDISNSVQLVFSQKELSERKAELVLYLVKPKFNFVDDRTGKCFVSLDDQRSAKVYVRTGLTRLEGFSPVTDTLAVGEMRYYGVQFKGEIDFSLTTLNVQGQVVMLVQRGDSYPTTERFWRKSRNPLGDIVIVKAADYGDGSAESSFVVGVYALEPSTFSVLFLPDFKNLISLEFQKMTEMRLEADKYYYLDFLASEAVVESMLYAEDNDVQASLLNYDDHKRQDLVTMISDEKNYFQKAVVRQGDPPLLNMNDFRRIANTHLVVRLISKGRSAKAGVLFFNPDKPIQAPAESRFHFKLDPDKEAVFVVRLDSRYRKVGVDVKLNFGKVSFAVSDRPDGFATQVKMAGKIQKYLDFQLSEPAKDIVLFNAVFIKVTSQETSRFSVLVRPQEKFKLLKVNEPEIVYTSPDSDTFLYFGCSAEQLLYTQRIELNVNSVSYFGGQPELLFTSTSANVPDGNSVFQPMPVVDFEETNMEELRQSVYKIRPVEGFFIVKLSRNVNRYPFKVSVAFNDIMTIEPNGLSRGLLPEATDKKHAYSLYLNEPGEYRLVWESCSSIQIDDFQFSGSAPGANATFEANMFQSYPVIFLDETLRQTARSFEKVRYPILRGQITGPGKLLFTISPGSPADRPERTEGERSVPVRKSYVLMSEFKPANKQLVLKDYVEIFRDQTSFSQFYVSHNFMQTKSQLKLTISKPSFKVQLFDDYPSLRKLQVKFKVYLMSKKEFMHDIKVCGLSALESYTKSQQTVVLELTPDEARRLDGTGTVEVVFRKEDLDLFAKKEKLNVACYLSVRFFENEEEEWKVSLDLKYTNVPYFLLTINNEYVSIEQLKLILAIVIFVFLFIGFVFYAIFNCNNRLEGLKRVPEGMGEEDEEQGQHEEHEEESGVSSIMSETERLHGKQGEE
jgi:hypothetical protein